MKSQAIKQRPNTHALPGLSFERAVAAIQRMMDPASTVTHNEKLIDRVGNKRQYDVVIRGQFGGRPILGVMECKDHNRKKGPAEVEAFAKKTENLGANLRMMVSRKGFTEQALQLAKHENIGCLSLLPDDPKQAGFSIGDMWYGKICKWTDIRMTIYYVAETAPLAAFDSNTVKWEGKPVINWFLKELYTTYTEVTQEGEHTLEHIFDQPRNIEVEGKEYLLKRIACSAVRICKNKKKWVSWSGDAFYDWHTGQFTLPSGGTLVGSAVETDLSTWDDYEGEIPDGEAPAPTGAFCVVVTHIQRWDHSKDGDVPDLGSL